MERLPFYPGRNIWLSATYRADCLQDLQNSKSWMVEQAIEQFPYLKGYTHLAQALWLEYMELVYKKSVRDRPDASAFYYHSVHVIIPKLEHIPAWDTPQLPDSLRLFDYPDSGHFLDVTQFLPLLLLITEVPPTFNTDFQQIKAQRWVSTTHINAIYCPLFSDKFRLIGIEDKLKPASVREAYYAENFSPQPAFSIV